MTMTMAVTALAHIKNDRPRGGLGKQHVLLSVLAPSNSSNCCCQGTTL
jgi:hypothetical protein